MDFLTRTALLAANAEIRAKLCGAPRPVASGPLSAEHSRLLDSIVRADPRAPVDAIVRRFERHAGRPVALATVARRQRERLELLATVAAWPEWTDTTCVDIPWDDDEIIGLGRNGRNFTPIQGSH